MRIVDAFEISWFFTTSTAVHTETYIMPEGVAKDGVDFRMCFHVFLGVIVHFLVGHHFLEVFYQVRFGWRDHVTWSENTCSLSIELKEVRGGASPWWCIEAR